MALVTQFICKQCERPRTEVVYYHDGLCIDCRTSLAEIKRDATMKGLELMPLDSRIRRLEGFFYDLEIDKRLKALEAMNARY